MRATVPGLLAAFALALGACGDDAPLPVSGPAVTPTPPPTDELKFDMVRAVRALDDYRLAEGVYTDDENLLGPTFPRTVTVKAAGARSYYLAAYDAQGIRYAIVKDDDGVRRTCDPPDPDACPDGTW